MTGTGAKIMRVADRPSKSKRREMPSNGHVAIRIAGRGDIPATVHDFESFREWARSPDCPEHLRVAFYNNVLWIDPDMEQIYDHNLIIHRVAMVLGPLVEDIGIYGGDGVLLSNPEARLSTVPDGYFVSDRAIETGRVRDVEGKSHGFVELVGSPEMVLEVVSDSSETKDLVEMRELYWRAGIDEYWLIDGRTGEPVFDILKRGPKGYLATRKQAGGWQRSDVFGGSFRLVRKQRRTGRSVFTLEVK
jgi:Uma2 family endonuclease